MKQIDFKTLTDTQIAETVAELHDTRTCPTHRIVYPLLTGLREFDCPECRQEDEQRELLLARVRAQRETRLRQMEAKEAVHRADTEQLQPYPPPANWEREFVKMVVAVLIIVAFVGMCMAAQNKNLAQQNAQQAQEGRR